MGALQIAIVPVTAFQQNCTLLWDEDSRQGTVVDPGGDVPRLLAAIDETGMVVERLLLTHGHLDHAGGAAELREALAGRGQTVPIEGPDERDAFLLANLEAQGRQMGLPGMRSVTPDRWLAEGDSIDIAGSRFDILHCPGHTPGHLVFIDAEHRVALVGDTLFAGSVGRTDFPYGDGPQLIANIRRTLLPLPDRLPFICGHGPSSTIGEERRHNPFLLGE